MMAWGTFAIVFLALLNGSGFFTVVAAQTPNGLVMNTPLLLTLCQNANLSWANASPGPVYVSVVPGGQPTADALKTFDQVDASQGSVLWLVDQPVGTSLTILIRDSTGETTGSAAVTVKKGVDDSCLRGIGQDSSSTKGDQPKTSSSNTNGYPASDHPNNQSPTSNSTQSSVSQSASPSTPTGPEDNSTAPVTMTGSKNNNSTSPLTSTTPSNPVTAGNANGNDISTSTDSTNGRESLPSSSPPNGAVRAFHPGLDGLWLATMGVAALAVVLVGSSTH